MPLCAHPVGAAHGDVVLLLARFIRAVGSGTVWTSACAELLVLRVVVTIVRLRPFVGPSSWLVVLLELVLPTSMQQLVLVLVMVPRPVWVGRQLRVLRPSESGPARTTVYSQQKFWKERSEMLSILNKDAEEGDRRKSMWTDEEKKMSGSRQGNR